MKIDRDGTPFIAVSAVPALALALAGRRRLACAALAVPLAVGAFFRDPDRGPDLGAEGDPDVVLAPADGKVMHVGTPQDGVAPPGDWQQISIFLSLSDVHINRTPVAGTVVAVGHRPGRYLAAFRAASAQENERSEIAVESEVDGELRTVVFRQIVGVAARRVVTRVGVGDDLVAGERIGLMRFGSRMDVFVPPQVDIEVALGDRTIGGESVLARWPSSSPAVGTGP
ncbi:phosphatidylserine decarboxylase [Aquihabitans daechungensis]|uniref:phosphatidylserine decarboxylase n=1 Tax=Aquihabitans daechungensis TaxID=1052257 RepID=UPI003BA005D7